MNKITKIPRVYSGPMFIVLAALLWGFDGVLRRSLFSLPPSIIVFYEHLIGAVIIAPFALPLLKGQKISRKEWMALAWVSFLSGVVGTLFFTAALVKVHFISISVVFLLQKLQPIFAIGTAMIVLKERVTSRFIAWASLALVAAYFVTFPNGRVDISTGAGTAIAALLAVGAAFAWGSSTAFSRFALLRLPHTLTTGLRFFVTVPMAFLAVLILRNASDLSTPGQFEFGRLALIALTTGMVALWIYYKGLKDTQVRVSTFLEFVFPVTAVLLDMIIYHTVLAPSQYGAALVLFVAIYQISKQNRLNNEISL